MRNGASEELYIHTHTTYSAPCGHDESTSALQGSYGTLIEKFLQSKK